MSGFDKLEGMRRVADSELSLGFVLPGNLRDRSGRILVRRGQRLSEAHMKLLLDRKVGSIYTEMEWQSPEQQAEEAHSQQESTPDELMRALHRKNDAGRGKKQVRKHERHTWRVDMRLVVREFSGDMVQMRQLRVKTCDVSAKGFAFVSDRFLHPGSVVYACFESLPNRPLMKGIVRNCTHLSGRQHRSGVEFDKLDKGEAFPRELMTASTNS